MIGVAITTQLIESVPRLEIQARHFGNLLNKHLGVGQ